MWKDKIARIRKQIADGSYEDNRKLDMAVDRLLENLMPKKLMPKNYLSNDTRAILEHCAHVKLAMLEQLHRDTVAFMGDKCDNTIINNISRERTKIEAAISALNLHFAGQFKKEHRTWRPSRHPSFPPVGMDSKKGKTNVQG
jgi:hypothetical protein